MRRETEKFLEFIAKSNVELEKQREIIEKQEKLIKRQEKGNTPNETLLAIAFDEMSKKVNKCCEIVDRLNEWVAIQDKRIDALDDRLSRAMKGEKDESIIDLYKPE